VLDDCIVPTDAAITEIPAATAVTVTLDGVPLDGFIDVTDGLPFDHVAPTACVLPSENVPMQESAVPCPGVSDALAGVTVMPVRTGVTVTVRWAWTPPNAAVTVAVPGTLPSTVTCEAGDPVIDAIVALLVVHAAATGWMLPSSYVPATESDADPPSGIDTLAGLIRSDISTGGGGGSSVALCWLHAAAAPARKTASHAFLIVVTSAGQSVAGLPRF
jgi:hypothetical protein